MQLWSSRRYLIVFFAAVAITGCDLLGHIPVPDLFGGSTEQSEAPNWNTLVRGAAKRVRGHNGELIDIKRTNSEAYPLVTLGADGLVLGWDLGEQGATPLFRLPGKALVGALADDRQLVAFTDGSGVQVSCVTGCRDSWKLDRLKVRPTSMAFHADDRAVLFGGADGRVYRWRFSDEAQASSTMEKEKALERYVAHTSVVNAVASHPFGRAFFSADWQGNLLGWLPYDADDYKGEYDTNVFGGGRGLLGPGTFTLSNRAKDRGIVSMAVSGNGERLAIGAEDGHVELWEVRGFVLSARRKSHEGRVYSVAISQDGLTVASAGRDDRVSVARAEPDPNHRVTPDALAKRFTKESSFPMPQVRKVTFVSDRKLAASTRDGTLAEITVDSMAALAVATPVVAPSAPIDTDY